VYKEKDINKFLQYLKNINYNGDEIEIIVVDGDNGSTINSITIEDIIKLSCAKGRANQMNEGAKKATGEILLFLHADTYLPKNAIALIINTLSSHTISAGAFDLDFDTDNKKIKTIAKVASWRSRKTQLPYGDQAIFIKRKVFERVKGYENYLLMEDINLMQKLKKKKFQIKILDQKVITSAKKWEENGVVKNTLRNWLLIGLYFCGIHPNRLAKYYK
jgi:rSAM/selenodomain-associated transferase 2